MEDFDFDFGGFEFGEEKPQEKTRIESKKGSAERIMAKYMLIKDIRYTEWINRQEIEQWQRREQRI